MESLCLNLPYAMIYLLRQKVWRIQDEVAELKKSNENGPEYKGDIIKLALQ